MQDRGLTADGHSRAMQQPRAAPLRSSAPCCIRSRGAASGRSHRRALCCTEDRRDNVGSFRAWTASAEAYAYLVIIFRMTSGSRVDLNVAASTQTTVI